MNNTKWPWTTVKPGITFASPPKITVVTPSYQQGQFIEETILSVLHQEYPNLEFLVFDGGSTDDTVSVLQRYDDRIDYWESCPDEGQSHAINKGFKRATGDIVCWLNSDDYYYPNTLWRVAKHFQDGNFNQIYFGGGNWLIDKYGFTIPNPTTKLAKKHTIDLCDFIIQPSSFWGRNVQETVGELSTELHYGFDWEWFIRADRAGIPFVSTNNIFSCYRIHANHKSGSAGEKRVQELASIYRKYHEDRLVAVAYENLYATTSNLRWKSYLKRWPIGQDALAKVWWRREFSDIPFPIFNGIRKM